MWHLPALSIGLAAALFCCLSALMNALFLSSLGRTANESAIFAALSLAADVTKVALPVVVVRAVQLRAWGHVGAASVLLLVVTLLSVASGAGFAATTRAGVVASRQDDADKRVRLQQHLDELGMRRAAIPAGASVTVNDAELARLTIDRRWSGSKQCSDIAGASTRQFCSEVLRLKAARAMAADREKLEAEYAIAQTRFAATASIQQEPDPQAAAVAELLGVEASRLRRLLSLILAVIVELGSVILILLLSGPALRRWHDRSQRPESVLAQMPVSSDVVAWQRRREANRFALKQE